MEAIAVADEARDEGRDSGTTRGDASLSAGVDLKMESQDRDSWIGRGDALLLAGIDLKVESELGSHQGSADGGVAPSGGSSAERAPRRWRDSEDAGGQHGREKTRRPDGTPAAEPPD